MTLKSSWIMSPQIGNLVMSGPMPAQWNLSTSGMGDSSTFKTVHVPMGTSQGSSGQNMPPATCSC